MKHGLPGPLLRVGVLFGTLLVATALVGAPAGARADPPCRDKAGFWCLYGKPDLQDGGGLFGTNNPNDDVRLTGDFAWFNDRTRSVINRTGSYLGLYDDINFKGLMVCLPPNGRQNTVPAGVSSMRIDPARGAACATGVVKKKRKAPPEVKKSPSDDKTPAPPSKQAKAQDKTPDATVKPSPRTDLPSANAPSPALPMAPPVDTAGTEPAAAQDDGVAWGSVAAIAAAGAAILVLAGLGIGGWVFGRRRRSAAQVPRTATDPHAARRVHRALLLLAVDCEQDKREVPKVRAVTVDDTEVALHLAADDENAPRPWRVASGGRRWCLLATDIDELTDDVQPVAPYPLLATVRPGMWVNLAALAGPIALTGHRKAARKAAMELARWLRESPWHEGVRVRMVGFPPQASIEPEDRTERGRVVFIDDGMEVPAKPPPGSAVVTVGRPDGAGTTWRVRFDGSIVPPADVLAKNPLPAAGDTDPAAGDTVPSSAGTEPVFADSDSDTASAGSSSVGKK